MYSKIATLAFAAAVVVACNNSVIQPPTGPNTEYPCGYQGKSCDPVAPGMCCSLDEDCGYSGPWSTCPEGYCCYNGGEDTRYPSARRTGTRRPQWRPER